jgi:hypothetical protein
MTTCKTPEMADSDVNARLRSLKAAAWNDEAAIYAALGRLLADPAGRASLVQHLADMAALAMDPSLTDVQRGRWLRGHYEPSQHRPFPSQRRPFPSPGGLMARLAARRVS